MLCEFQQKPLIWGIDARLTMTNADERWRDVRSKCHTRHLAYAIRDRYPQGENRGHENVKERCTVRLLVYYIFYGLNIQPRHQPIENIRSRQLVSYPFILLSMVWPGHESWILMQILASQLSSTLILVWPGLNYVSLVI
jgi:hypothetical protein